jgi:hypothetical protein
VLWAFRVKVWNEGPHLGKPEGLTDRVAPGGETLVVSTTGAETVGVHLNESVAVPWSFESPPP